MLCSPGTHPFFLGFELTPLLGLGSHSLVWSDSELPGLRGSCLRLLAIPTLGPWGRDQALCLEGALSWRAGQTGCEGVCGPVTRIPGVTHPPGVYIPVVADITWRGNCFLIMKEHSGDFFFPPFGAPITNPMLLFIIFVFKIISPEKRVDWVF